MKTDAEDFRRLYASLNDDALLAINRDDLIPIAQQCLDEEIASRGIDVEEVVEVEETTAPAFNPEDLVEIAVFDEPSEATVARSLLRIAEIPCALSTDLPLVGNMFNTTTAVKLYVPSEFADEAVTVLEAEMSEEELAAQAEAAAMVEDETVIEEEIIEEEIESEE
jgi:hypothetical protein